MFTNSSFDAYSLVLALRASLDLETFNYQHERNRSLLLLARLIAMIFESKGLSFISVSIRSKSVTVREKHKLYKAFTKSLEQNCPQKMELLKTCALTKLLKFEARI